MHMNTNFYKGVLICAKLVLSEAAKEINIRRAWMGSLSMMRAISKGLALPKTIYTTCVSFIFERLRLRCRISFNTPCGLCLEGGRKDGATSEKKILCPLL
jgi:hypothetical protein